MLQNTFLHVPGISEAKEQKLWHNDIRTWDDVLKMDTNVPNIHHIKQYIEFSKDRYEKKDYAFFSRSLLYKHHWRAYPDFIDKCCFLDIETTGLSKVSNDITLIGLFDGNNSKTFINGKNLEDFRDEINKYSFIVTFNGYCFDLPFIKTKFPDIKFNQFHVDLRFLMRNLGFTGGLKKIEKLFNIKRPDDISDMDGLDAVRLWYEYKRYNDQDALHRLINYNNEDIKNLKLLMDFSFDEMRNKIFI